MITTCASAQYEPGLEVNSAYGKFVFHAHIEQGQNGFNKLKGELVNGTTRNWTRVEFTPIYYWVNGNVLPAEYIYPLIFNNLGKGKSVEFDVLAERLGANIGRFDIRFQSGTVQANYTFALLTKGGQPATDLSFSDTSVSFTFSVSKQEFGFLLKNNTDQPIEIDWNRVAFVDVTGESHKVIHSGVKFIERSQPLVATTIPPSAKIEDIVFPSDYVYFREGQHGGWSEYPLFPDGEKAAPYKGQTFTVFMPMKINGVVKNYSFKFKITDVEF